MSDDSHLGPLSIAGYNAMWEGIYASIRSSAQKAHDDYVTSMAEIESQRERARQQAAEVARIMRQMEIKQ